MQMVKIKMIRKWYSTEKLTSKKSNIESIKYNKVDDYNCKIMQSNKKMQYSNFSASNYKNVYICVCALKPDENTRRN